MAGYLNGFYKYRKFQVVEGEWFEFLSSSRLVEAFEGRNGSRVEIGLRIVVIFSVVVTFASSTESAIMLSNAVEFETYTWRSA